MKNVLFVCSQNKLRSPTAEQVFANWPEIEVSSAGTNKDAENPLSNELVEWADIVFVMEKAHRAKVQGKYRSALKDKRLICLHIPDDYDFMDPALVQLLKAKVHGISKPVHATVALAAKLRGRWLNLLRDIFGKLGRTAT